MGVRPAGSKLIRRARGPGRAARCLAGLLAVLWSGTASRVAAQPFVVDPWRFGTRDNNSALAYCIDARDPDQPVARSIGRALAEALLLQPREYLMSADFRTADMSGEDMDNLYRVLIEHCDVVLGFKLVANAYPAWLTVTRPYYRSRYVYLTATPTWNRLSDLPVDAAIGATIGTAADMRLSQYLVAVGPDRAWSKYPMSSDEAALAAVVAGTTAAALVWAPTLWSLAQTDTRIASLTPLAPDPLPVSFADVGAILLTKQPFLRANLDQAIASLTADGTLAAILAQAKFPAEVVR